MNIRTLLRTTNIVEFLHRWAEGGFLFFHYHITYSRIVYSLAGLHFWVFLRGYYFIMYHI